MNEVALIVLAVAIAGTGAALVAMGLRVGRTSPIDELLAEFEGSPDMLDDYTRRLQEPVFKRILAPLGTNITGSLQEFLPRNHVQNIRRRLVLAGMAGRFTAEEYLAGQVVGLVAGALLGLMVAVALAWPGTRMVGMTVGFAVLGVFTPSLAVRQNREKRIEAIEKELPDVLDVLAISVEAGVGLEGAIQAVTERFHSPLADELAHTLSEMELGLSRREALHNLRARTDIPDLNGFVLALVQADALGMPMTRVLQTQADEMRRRRRQKVREEAAKLPVKLIFPLVVFILPSLFIVILGPAVIRIANAIGG